MNKTNTRPQYERTWVYRPIVYLFLSIRCMFSSSYLLDVSLVADSRVATSGRDKRLKHIKHEAWFAMFTEYA